MAIRISSLIFLITISLCGFVFGLEPGEVFVLVNGDIGDSVEVGDYYIKARGIPAENILKLSLGAELRETISRDAYNSKIAEPVREILHSDEFAGRIRCLVTTYGVPIKVQGRAQLEGMDNKLRQLKIVLDEKTKKSREINQSVKQKKADELELLRLQIQIDYIEGKETSASLDSELSLVLFDDYELYRWQPNRLAYKMPYWDNESLMVSRLDGPGVDIAKGLIDKAIRAEKEGLKGKAYIDQGYSLIKQKEQLYKQYDLSLEAMAEAVKAKTNLSVVLNRGAELFASGECPDTAIYCGWYSVAKYIDAFDFVDGAVGYHIASFEAQNLRDLNSKNWCPAMLRDGITATFGAVDEPYLASLPKPDEFFNDLFDGYCLAEAFYRTNPYNSWQLVLIGDPLYRPFKKF